jgi:hypothetical protein
LGFARPLEPHRGALDQLLPIFLDESLAIAEIFLPLKGVMLGTKPLSSNEIRGKHVLTLFAIAMDENLLDFPFEVAVDLQRSRRGLHPTIKTCTDATD